MPSVEARLQEAVLPLQVTEAVVARTETSDLMERFQKAMTKVRGSRTLSGSADSTSPPRKQNKDAVQTTSPTKKTSATSKAPKKTETQEHGLTNVHSRSISGVLSSVSRHASGTASLWMRKTTSCLTSVSESFDRDGDESVHCERRPSEDILVMVQEQQRRYDDAVKQTKAEIRMTTRRNDFLRSQLEAIKKTNPKQRSLMRAVDELDAMVSAAGKLDLKLQSLKEEHAMLHRKVFSHQAAQEALESLGGNRLTIHDDEWHRDLEVFSKLAYAGLLKGHNDTT